MSKTPVIRSREIPGKPYGARGRVVIRAFAGLHYIKGNSSPYFSLTGEVSRVIARHDGQAILAREPEICGCIHDELIREWPDLAPLAAMHLSGLDGAPMHAEGNGFYWLAGAAASPHAPRLPVWGAKYHGASGDYGKTPAECLKIAANHFRVAESELAPFVESRYESGAVMKARVAAFTAAQRERWQREAESAIETYGLELCGDVAAWKARQGDTQAAQ